MLSGHLACCRIECTAAIDPRRYSRSRVIATWTRLGSQTLVPPNIEASTELHSSALRNAEALRNANRSGEPRAAEASSAGNLRPPPPPSRREERVATAGENDWKDGERTTMTIAAEKKPENRRIQSILAVKIPRRFLFFDLKSNRSARIDDERDERRNDSVALRSARALSRKRATPKKRKKKKKTSAESEQSNRERERERARRRGGIDLLLPLAAAQSRGPGRPRIHRRANKATRERRVGAKPRRNGIHHGGDRAKASQCSLSLSLSTPFSLCLC
ncbi:hypothetical protein EUGRSUZ_K03516 [Eucalyptus grandis]|uniref:Uncharacterized protein n=2 Tax=Eucalyptus grandis TaxID=71139 RepID=A0ACC3IZT7_EUCGR|nr:hypothetical protein EUGRSUZ_K03516 [Eucalyptus grandis]